jgi:hypothetical protein
LNDLKHTLTGSAQRLNNGQHNVTAIEHGNGSTKSLVHIQNNAEPQRELPAAFALEKQVTADPDRVA